MKISKNATSPALAENKMKSSDIEKKLKPKKKPPKKLEGLSSGSTLLNLACSGNTEVAFYTGLFYLFVGDSSSGKSFIALTAFAELCNNPIFDDYQIIYDNAENGALMDLGKFFGSKIANRLKAPKYEDGLPKFSSTVEEFYYNVDTASQNGPFFYVLDSMDSLESADDQEKFKERKIAYEKGKSKEVSGSYGTAKAKANSVGLRRLNNVLVATNSICIIISQTRENIGFDAQFNPKTRGGGKALRFYAALEIWTSIKERLKKPVRGKQVPIGIIAQVKVKKNRQTGVEPTIEIPILHTHGIDDVASCIDYLIEWKHWTETKGVIKAPEFDFEGKQEKLIELIQDEEKEPDLRDIVQEVWDEVKETATPNRKKKYE